MSGGGISGLAPIQKVFQMAKKTFARSRGPDGKRRHRLDSQDLRSHLKQLSELMNVLTAKDLALDQSQVCEIHHSPYIIGYQDLFSVGYAVKALLRQRVLNRTMLSLINQTVGKQ